ncbi:MAG TPA: hypothetical protein VHB49_07210 [Bradyrhizobium sp.]|nr:hypothetical protein [Bradyrhizobium sp.]
MESFVHNANIRHYQKLLEQETEEERRKVIRELLAEETMKALGDPGGIAPGMPK